MTISSWLNFGHHAPPGSGLWQGEIFWLCLTTASVQCLHLLWAFFPHWFSKIGISGIPAISTAISVYNGLLSWMSVKLVPTCQLMIALCSCLVDLILGWHLWCCYILPFCCALISVCFMCILCMLVVYCHINQYYKALYLGCPGILQIGTWNYSVSLRFHGHFSRWTCVSRFYWS